MKCMKVKSLAGTNEEYILVQMRRHCAAVKVQGGGQKVNRDYGFTEDIYEGSLLEFVDSAVSNYYGITLHPTSDVKYLLVQARLKGDLIKVQCLCKAQNREYGFTTEFLANKVPVFASFLELNS